MLVKVKLLNPIKNSLFNAFFRNRYKLNYRISQGNIANNFNIVYSLCYLQKKANKEKYNTLKEKIFSPLSLSLNIVRVNETRPEEIPCLIFDHLRIRELEPYYFKKAEKHLKKIKNFSARFKALEERVREFNNTLNIENKEISEIVSNYFKGRGFKITTDNSKPSVKENTIVTNTLLNELKLFWRRNQFNSIQETEDENGNKELRIRGALIAAVVSKDNKKKIDKCIECLKNNEIIRQKYNVIGTEIIEIVGEADKLSSEIKQKLIDT